MSSFDIASYLNNQYEQANQKLLAVQEASKRKQEELSQISSVPPRPETWAEQLGLRRNSMATDAVDLAGSVATGVSRIAGNLVGGSAMLDHAIRMGDISEVMIEAYNREKTGQATPEEIELLNHAERPGHSVRNQIDAAIRDSKNVEAVNKAFDISHVRDGSAQENLSKSLSQVYEGQKDKFKTDSFLDTLSGIGGLAVDATGALLKNPKGVINFAAENLPQIGLAAAGPIGIGAMTASNVGYAGNEYHKAFTENVEKHGTVLPQETRTRNQILASTLFAADQAGDIGSAIAAKVIGKAATGVVGDAAERLSFKQAVLNTAKGVAGGSASEAPTESYQEWAEGEIEGKPKTAGEIFAGGVIGAASGGTISGGARAVQEAATLLTQGKDPNAPQKSKDAPEVQDAVKKAAETGDVSGLVSEKEGEVYAPARAIGALFSHSQKNPEKLEENITKADEILEDISGRIEDAKEFLVPDEEIKTNIARTENILKQLPEDHPLVTELTDSLDSFKAALTNREANQKKVAELEKLYAEANTNYEHFTGLNKTKEEGKDVDPKEVDQLVQDIQSPVPEVNSTESADRLITLAMANPDLLSQEVATQLAENADNGLTADQRQYLRSFSAARQAENELQTMGGVSKEILYGSEKHLGIAQYKQHISNAIADGNQAKAQRYLQWLSNFVNSHESKAAAAKEALDGPIKQIVREHGGWKVSNEKLTAAARKENGARFINSQLLVDNIAQEAKLLKDIQQNLKDTVDRKFAGTKPAQTQPKTVSKQLELFNRAEEAINVQNTPQQGRGTQNQDAAVQVQADERTGSTGSRNANEGSAGEVSTTPKQEDTSGGLDSAKTATNANGVYYTHKTEGVGEVRISESRYGVHKKFIGESGKRSDSVLNQEGDFVSPNEILRNRDDVPAENKAWLGDADSRKVVSQIAHFLDNLDVPDADIKKLNQLIKDVVTGNLPATEAKTQADQILKGEHTPSKQEAAPAPIKSNSWALDNDRTIVDAIRKSNPKLLDQVEELHAQDRVADEIAKQLGVEKDLVRSIRNGLGLPDQGKGSANIAGMNTPDDAEQRAIFEKWVKDRESKGTLQQSREAPVVGSKTTEASIEVKPKEIEKQASTQEKQESSAPTEQPVEAQGEAAATVQATAGAVANAEAYRNLTDAQLNDRLNKAMEQPGYQESQEFKDLDAEMTRREDAAATEMTADQPVSSDPPGLEALRQGQEANKEFEDKKLSDTVERVINGKVEKPTVYQLINRAALWLKQKHKAATEDGGLPSGRPLVIYSKFLSDWKKGVFDVIQFLPDGTELNDAQDGALNTFLDTAGKWFSSFEETLIKGSLQKRLKNGKLSAPIREDFLYKDPVQDLLWKDGDTTKVDENLVAAMVYGAYSWFAENAGSRFIDDESIVKMVGLDPNSGAYVQANRRNLSTLTGSKNHIANSIGARIVKAMGFTADASAGKDYLPALQMGLGIRALDTLEKLGYLNTRFLSEDFLEDSIDGFIAVPLMGKDGNPLVDKDGNKLYPNRTFIQFNRDEAGELTGSNGTVILESQRGSGGVLNKLFTGEDSGTYASTEPAKFTQRFASKTKQEIVPKLKGILGKAQQIPQMANQAMLNTFKVLGDDLVLRVAGSVDLSDPNIQAMNRDKYEANNDGLKRQFLDMMGLINAHPLGTAWFPRFDVWSNFRVGQKTRDMNMQTSKIHRYTYYRPGWKVMLNDKDETVMLNYKMAMAQAFGIKIDEKPFNEIKDVFDDLINDKENRIAELADALHKANKDPEKNTLSDEDKAAIAKIAADREGMQTLQAIVSLGDYLNRVDGSFETILLVGVDGKTNGPILTQLALGAHSDADSLMKTLNKGGFYTEKDGVKFFSAWYNGGANQDMYQDLGSNIVQQLNYSDPSIAALDVILGKLLKDGKLSSSGRNLAKKPTAAVNFGSSIKRSIESMQEYIIQSMYDRIEALAKGKDPENLNLPKLVAAINSLIIYPDLQIKADISLGDLLKYKFSLQQQRVIKAHLFETLKSSVDYAMESTYGGLLTRKTALIQASNLTFEIYTVARSALLAKEMARLMDAGEIPYRTYKDKDDNEVREPLRDMSPQEEEAMMSKLKSLMPRAHTAYSMFANDLDAGLLMAKTTTRQGYMPFHDVKAYMGRYVRRVDHYGNTHWDVSASGTAYIRQLTNPGVGVLAAMMHSTDSAVMHFALEGTEILNVHDEGGDSVTNVMETAHRLNKNTWNVLSEYSPLREALDALAQAEAVLAELHKQGKLPDAALALIAKSFGRNIPEDMRPRFMDISYRFNVGGAMLHQEYRNAEITRLNTLLSIKYIDQYTWEGGQYEVTSEDHQRIQNQLDKLLALGEAPLEHEASSQYLLAQLERIVEEDKNERLKAKNTQNKPIVQKTQPPKQEAPVTPPDEDNPVDETPEVVVTIEEAIGENDFGPLGESQYPSNPTIQAYFERKGTRTAAEVIKELKQYFGEGKSTANAFQALLLNRLEKLIAPDLVIKYITKDSKASDVKGGIKKNAFGWTNVTETGTGAEIYVLSPDYQASGLTAELLIHELVHAALARAVASNSAKVAAYKKGLENLMSEVKTSLEKFIKEDPSLIEFRHAVEDLNEFLAYGLTSQRFQTEVLAKIPVKSPVMGKLGKALQAFVQLAAKILGFNTEEQTNALGAFIANTAGLIHQMEQNAPTRRLGASARTASHTMSVPPERSPGDAEVEAIRAYDTQEIFAALNPNDEASSKFSGHLKEILNNIVEKLHGPFGSFAAEARKTEAANPYMAWLKAVETGKAPFAAQVIASPMKSNAQQDFVAEQVEATVMAVLDRGDANTTLAYRELSQLYMEAYRTLKPQNFHKGDWATATQYEKDIAQQKFDFVFKMDSRQGKQSDYLARFAALGLGNQEFNELLNFNTEVKADPGKPKTIGERLKRLFVKMLGIFSNKVTGTYEGQKADEKLQTLVQQLVDIEARKRHKLALKVEKSSFVNMTEEHVKAATDKLKSKVEDFAGSALFKDSKYAVVRAAGSLTRTVAGNRTEQLLENLSHIRDMMFDEQSGFISGMLNDLKHPTDALKKMLMQTKRNEQKRKEVITQVAKYVLEGFDQGGKNLSQEDKAAITSVFLRTGAHALLNDYSMIDLERVITDVNERNKMVADLESQLTGSFAGDYIVAAKSLGYFKATGQAKHQMLMMNAENIVRRLGTPDAKKVTDDEVKANKPLVEALVALYGISYSKSVDLSRARDVLKKENRRANGNGIEFVLGVHKNLEEQSRADLFASDSAQMMHGYLPEIMNPHTKLGIASGSAASNLVNQGYSKVSEIELDPGDPNRDPVSLYVLKDGGLAPYVSGILSMDSLQAKGSKSQGIEDKVMAQQIAAKRNVPRMSVQQAAKFDPSQVKQNFMVPLLDPKGRVANWRYMMSEHTKDTLMERNNSFEHLLGASAGALLYKPAAQKQNRTVISALKEVYEAEFGEHPERYMEIGPMASSQEAREMWAMLPKETRRDVKAIWGDTPLTVRKDAALMIFGARKLSAAGMFQRANDERNANREAGLPTEITSLDSINFAEKAIVTAVETVLTVVGQIRGLSDAEAQAQATKAAVLVARGERAWQEIVAEVKDIIVVKTGLTLAWNIYSNFWMLGLNGVPLKDMAHHHYVAIKATMAYRKDSAELAKLVALRDTGYTQGNEKEIRREILRLEDAIERNPVKRLIDEGMMPTIVDDVTMDQDPYSYKSTLSQKMDKYAQKIHPGIRKAANIAYIGHDTSLYQFLNQATQMSDFVARYAMYQHLTTRAKNPMTHEQAVMKSMDSFINYDIPMHPLMQYSDDMGFTYFTKYFLRIQRELMRTLADNPMRVLSTVAVGQYMDLGDTVLETHWIPKFGNNPFRWGPAEIFNALPELATTNSAMALLK